MSGCFTIMQTSSRTLCSFFRGEGEYCLRERTEKNINLLEFSIKKKKKKVLERITGFAENLFWRYEIHEVIILSIFTSLQRKAINLIGNYGYLKQDKIRFCLLHFQMC